MSSDTELATSRLADRNWRRRHSAWLLAVCLGVGLLSFIGFVYGAFRVRTRRWWFIATAASLASAVTWVVSSFENSSGEMTDWAAGVVFVIWVAMMIAGFQLNREYLRWRASRTSAHAWYNQPAAPANAGGAFPPLGDATQAAPPTANDSPLRSMGIQREEYYAPPTAAHVAPTPSDSLAPRSQVDVNLATEAELVTALQVDQALAARVVEARREAGGFRDIDELVRVAGLQPHQMMRFRNRVVFGPIKEKPNEGPGADRRGGRILDF